MKKDRPAFVKIGKGAGRGKVVVKDCLGIGDIDVVNLQGEKGADIELDNNKIVTPQEQISPDILPESSSFNISIIGIILAAVLSLVVGIILLNYEWHHEEATQLGNNQSQKQESKK